MRETMVWPDHNRGCWRPGRLSSMVVAFAMASLLPDLAANAAEQTNRAAKPTYNVRAGTMTNVVVAADGSGQFKSAQEGIQAAATGTASQPVVVRIKPGVYKELIYIQREKRFLRLVGENATNTILKYDLNANLPGQD